MGEFSFETQGSNTYLVYKIGEKDTVDDMCLGMLTANSGKIPGLIAASYTQFDEDKYIKYNVSSRVAASQIFSGVVNKARLIGVFDGILDAVISAEDYMIDMNTILFDMDYIYVNSATCETGLICLPIVNENAEEIDVGTFFKKIMYDTQFDQTENVDHVTKILNYLNSASVFSIQAFEDLIEEIKNEKNAEPAVTVKPVTPGVAKTTQKTVPQKSAKVPEKPVAKPVVQQVVSQPGVNPPVNVPVVKPAEPPKQKSSNKASSPESKDSSNNMSLIYLLRHYSKENLEIYKSQKDSDEPKVAEAPKTNFAVPGGQSFAIPGVQSIVVPDGPDPTGEILEMQGKSKSKNAPQAVPVIPNEQEQPLEVERKNFGSTTLLEKAPKQGATTLLSADMMQEVEHIPIPMLHREKNGENINIDKPSFVIGRDNSIVNYFISDNSAISKSHAIISTIDGKYFIKDTNSSNHVFVNGEQIPVATDIQIVSGAKIRLANEEFTFVVQ